MTLRDVEPRVLRVLDVPADSTLGELHELLQIAFGWLDRQSYQLVSGLAAFLGEPGAPPVGTLAGDLGSTFLYRYHPEHGWEHDAVVLGAGGDEAACVYGEGTCPPEGSGGPRRWAGFAVPGLEGEFRPALTDARVRQMAGAVPESVALLLRLVGDGVEVREGGGFPAEVTAAVHRRRPRWPATAEPETDRPGLPPLLALHGVLRSTGILVQRQGRLRPAAQAGDERFVVRRLRSWFAPGAFGAVVAATAVGHLAARGARSEAELVHAVLATMSPGDTTGEHDVRTALHHLRPALTGLDLAECTRSGWLPGPSARSLLPRATALFVREVGPAGLEPTTPAV
ncbi:hypothetical protein JCM9957A_08720 [Kineosporia succinea]